MNRKVMVGQYLLDVDELLDYSYRCEPLKCQEKEEYCCARFEVDISDTEANRLASLTQMAAVYAEDLYEEDGTLVNPFDEEEGRYYIDKNDEGDCVYTFVDAATGEKRCSAHAACLDAGLDPMVEKPLPCAIWPVNIGQRDDEGKIAVGFDLASNPVCLKQRPGHPKKLDPGVAELLRGLFRKKHGSVIRLIEEAGQRIKKSRK